jgi:hypothetical protein
VYAAKLANKLVKKKIQHKASSPVKTVPPTNPFSVESDMHMYITTCQLIKPPDAGGICPESIWIG